jgi:hypothetical protein
MSSVWSLLFRFLEQIFLHVSFSMRATYPTNRINLDLIIVIIIGEE